MCEAGIRTASWGSEEETRRVSLPARLGPPDKHQGDGAITILSYNELIIYTTKEAWKGLTGGGRCFGTDLELVAGHGWTKGPGSRENVPPLVTIPQWSGPLGEAARPGGGQGRGRRSQDACCPGGSGKGGDPPQQSCNPLVTPLGRVSPGVCYILLKYCCWGTSLAVQWLRLCASNAGGAGSIPGRGTKVPHATWCGQKNK